jgi:hypothetical protein
MHFGSSVTVTDNLRFIALNAMESKSEYLILIFEYIHIQVQV